MLQMVSYTMAILEDIVKKPEAQATAGVVAESVPVTGTKIYMNLGDPDLAENMVCCHVMALV